MEPARDRRGVPIGRLLSLAPRLINVKVPARRESPGWRGLLREVGIRAAPRLWRDTRWWLALAALPAATALAQAWPDRYAASADAARWLIVAAWQPLIEELLFRGVFQGQLRATPWGTRQWMGITAANVAVSIVFAAAHLTQHPAAWAGAVFFPSIVFGYFRDRYLSVIPSVLLHSAYNAAYLFANLAIIRASA